MINKPIETLKRESELGITTDFYIMRELLTKIEDLEIRIKKLEGVIK